MSHKDIKIIGDVFIGNPGIPGNGTDDYTVTILCGILQNGNAGILELSVDAIILVQIESQFMIAGNKEFPFGRERPKPGNEVIILTAFKIILHGITGTNYNIRILRHLQTAMIAMGVGEGEYSFVTDSNHSNSYRLSTTDSKLSWVQNVKLNDAANVLISSSL